MGNENERKHNPAENRQEWMGNDSDAGKKGGGDESNVGLTGAAGESSGAGGSVGTVGVIGGSADFLTDPEPSASSTASAPEGDPQSADSSTNPHVGSTPAASGAQHNLTDQQGGDTNFGGRTGAGSSFLASNTGQSDLGSAGIDPRGSQEEGEDR